MRCERLKYKRLGVYLQGLGDGRRNSALVWRMQSFRGFDLARFAIEESDTPAVCATVDPSVRPAVKLDILAAVFAGRVLTKFGFGHDDSLVG